MKAARRADIDPFKVMEVMKAAAERAASGGDVLHLEVGQPSTGAPAGAIAAAHAALDRETLGYTDATGIGELRARIARHYAERYGVDLPAERVLVTAGASGACVLAFLASFDVGARVAVTQPGYPCYRHMLTAFGIEAVPISVDDSTRFQPTIALLDAAAPLDGVVVGSPANPTGTVLLPDELASVSAWCAAHDVRLVVDEIYHGITYDAPATTALSAPGADQLLVVNSFSKYFSMTGWRVGWLVAPDDLLVPLERLAQNLFISPPTLAQRAAVAAFDCIDELDGHVARYARNRSVLLDGLRDAGITRVAPADGAFYVYADVSHLTDDSEALCRTWLAELGLAATAGTDFDPERGRHHVRFSFCGSADDITEAAHRLGAWCAERRRG